MGKVLVSVSIDKGIREKSEALMKMMGIDFDMAINVFLYQVYYTRSIPFPIKLPNEDK